MRVLWAIRDHQDLDIIYQSMHQPDPVRRWIAPHAIASDGSRWHARAWCHEKAYFKDFVLARIQSIHGARTSHIDPQTDAHWQTPTTIVLQASRELAIGQRRAVETEFGMRDGKLTVTMRQALLPYFVRQWRLDEQEHRPPRAAMIEWMNKADLRTLVAEVASR
jgi:predicted DNA-binding transcriptional regulator YafY